MSIHEQNDIAALRTKGIDLNPRWEEILQIIKNQTGFVPDLNSIRKSEWWKTGKIGAVHCAGTIIDGSKRKVVLKIQGTKPDTSEVDMINSFDAQNKSNIVRSPRVCGHIAWNEKRQFEAILLEKVDGEFAITKHPAPDVQLNGFFALYEEYKQNCVKKPWVKSVSDDFYEKRLNRWRSAVKMQIGEDKFLEPGDKKLAEEGTKIVEESIVANGLEFMHGHFEPGTLVVEKSGKAVIFSNLFWGWRNPFYDAVFGYHWWMLGMENAENFTLKLLENERKRWLEKIFSLKIVKSHPNAERLVNIALLERAVPALMVDRFLMDQNKLPAEIITKGARRELKRLIEICGPEAS